MPRVSRNKSYLIAHVMSPANTGLSKWSASSASFWISISLLRLFDLDDAILDVKLLHRYLELLGWYEVKL